ncbi:hypothetical protein [Sphingobacterium paludis]|uniref:Uncharacterized protein n=1 Tax=Sphingobacterium paludis TaxID=1476465 RepID=A0A4R7CSY1_9SPHI|nr:hypothetical protein [Sphingobacterium paludis]TDS08937.1 hypothetical protein B0I21_11166 [Sphingobacterium paludis]
MENKRNSGNIRHPYIYDILLRASHYEIGKTHLTIRELKELQKKNLKAKFLQAAGLSTRLLQRLPLQGTTMKYTTYARIARVMN